MKSIHLHTWDDLKVFGINSLTGESCKYGMRLLCDLSEKGVENIREAFGLTIVLNPLAQFSRNWNSTVGEEPAVASVMLPRDMFGFLSKFLLFREGFDIVIRTLDHSWAGYMLSDLPADMTIERMTGLYGTVYRNPTAGESGSSRNVHAMSGRIS